MNPGQSETIKLSGQKSKNTKWSSSNKTVAKVNTKGQAGETGKVTAKNAFGKISWSSDGDSVEVDASGNITAVKKGNHLV